MGADGSAATVPRHSELFKAVQSALIQALTDRGLTVLDETAVTMRTLDLTRTRRTDAELIGTAEIASVPIDVIAVHSLTVRLEEGFAGIGRLSLRLEGRLIDINARRALGGFEVSVPAADRPLVPSDCGRACLEEAALPFARDLAARLGADLASRLSASTDPSCDTRFAGVLTEFSGVDTDQLAAIVEEFSGPPFRGFKTTASGLTFVEFFIEACGGVTAVFSAAQALSAPPSLILSVRVERGRVVVESVARR
ncbi:MAG: hypothetical protein AAF318_17865 [Pseudomonadota bacterium]